jgi:adenylate cyclase
MIPLASAGRGLDIFQLLLKYKGSVIVHRHRSLIVQLILLALLEVWSSKARSAELGSLYAEAFSGRTDTNSANAVMELVTKHWAPMRDSLPVFRDRLEREVVRYQRANAPFLAQLRVQVSLGMLLKHMSEPAESIKHLYSSLALAERTQDHASRAFVQQEIGLNYYLQRRWRQALDFFTKSDRFYVETGQELRHRIQLYLIGLCKTNLGEHGSALAILGPLFATWKAEDDDRRMLETGSGLADALRRSGDLDSAEKLYLWLVRLASTNDGYIMGIMGRLKAGLAQVYYQQGRAGEAKESATEALNLARKYDYFFPKLDALEVLYQASRDLEEWRQAFTFLELLTHDRDSLQSEETNVQLGVARAVFEQQQQTSAIRSEEAAKRQVMLVGLILSTLLVVVVGFFYRSLSKQKSKSEGLLANILPREAIVDLKRTGEVTPQIHESVSILFADIKDFTSIAEALSPEELVNMLDTYVRAFDEIVHRNGLEKIKTIGDAYMVAGGLHGGHEASAEQCIRAGQEMLRTAESLRSDSLRRYGHAFDYRIGIHTGRVISGIVGRDKYAYDIWGDAVNVASRMEQHSEVGRINISEDTNAIVRTMIPTEYRGKILVKNKGEVGMYFVS